MINNLSLLVDSICKCEDIENWYNFLGEKFENENNLESYDFSSGSYIFDNILDIKSDDEIVSRLVSYDYDYYDNFSKNFGETPKEMWIHNGWLDIIKFYNQENYEVVILMTCTRIEKILRDAYTPIKNYPELNIMESSEVSSGKVKNKSPSSSASYVKFFLNGKSLILPERFLQKICDKICKTIQIEDSNWRNHVLRDLVMHGEMKEFSKQNANDVIIALFLILHIVTNNNQS